MRDVAIARGLMRRMNAGNLDGPGEVEGDAEAAPAPAAAAGPSPRPPRCPPAAPHPACLRWVFLLGVAYAHRTSAQHMCMACRAPCSGASKPQENMCRARLTC